MATIRDQNKKDKLGISYDEATEHVLSEGEILIKNLVQKQTDTNIKLHEQLKNVKTFDKSTEIIPLSNLTSGQITLEKFKECTKYIDNVEKLKYCDLTPQEIELYLDSQKGEDFLAKRHKNISKEVLSQQLKDINEKISRKDEDKIENNVSRLYKEIGLSVKPDSEETKLLKFALSNVSSKNDLPKSHPINSLKKLENDLFGHLDRDKVPNLAKRRKKLKKFEAESEVLQYNYTQEDNFPKTKSKWDVTEITEIPKSTKDYEINNIDLPTSSNICEKVYTCKPPQFYTVKDGEIHKLEKMDNEELKIKEYQKLSEEELKKIPRFQNYESGNPSKVLYVKNIAKSAIEEFQNLFKYHKNISCKLLTGKMKGQAFITFDSVNSATEALLKYNGYILNSKPIVIQYGKS